MRVHKRVPVRGVQLASTRDAWRSYHSVSARKSRAFESRAGCQAVESDGIAPKSQLAAND